jgi:hypothetical protein
VISKSKFLNLNNSFLKIFKISFLIIFVSVGCVSTHYDRSEKFLFSWKIGDLDSAVIEAEELAKNGPKRDQLLYQLEEGSIKRLNGDLEGSIQSFSNVSNEYDRWFGIHLNSKKRISEEFISTLGSAEWKPYKSRIYERVMMRYYQALNYLQLGHKGLARAEIFKIRQSIQDSKEIWEQELDVARKQMKKRGIDLNNGLLKSQKDPVMADINKMRSEFPSNSNKFINPAALYLESLYFLRGGSNRDDFEKAIHTLRELNSIYPKNQWIKEDYNLAKSFGSSSQPVTYIFFETGRAPVRVEKRFDLPLMYFSGTSRIPYLGIAMPSLVYNDQFVQDLKVFEKEGVGEVTTQILADFDSIVSQEFESYYPLELTRAITGSILRGGSQYIATNSIRSEDETLRTAAGVGVGLLAQAVTRADLRCWATLPKQIKFCKILNPPTNQLTIQGIGTNFKKKINLTPNQTNIVTVRSISSYVSLNIVNHITIP